VALSTNDAKQIHVRRARQPATGVLIRPAHFGQRRLRATHSRDALAQLNLSEHETRVSTLELINGVRHAVDTAVQRLFEIIDARVTERTWNSLSLR